MGVRQQSSRGRYDRNRAIERVKDRQRRRRVRVQVPNGRRKRANEDGGRRWSAIDRKSDARGRGFGGRLLFLGRLIVRLRRIFNCPVAPGGVLSIHCY